MSRCPIPLLLTAALAVASAPAPAFGQSAGLTGVAAISAIDTERALRCMTLAIAYEAGFEPVAGQEAVGQVIINRSRHPAYPGTVCGVVFQGSSRRTGCQFTFTCDGALRRRLSAGVMQNAEATARRVLQGQAPDRVGGAINYHANYVWPRWAPALVRIGQIGAHIFYRPADAAPVSAQYRPGAEPDPLALSPILPLLALSGGQLLEAAPPAATAASLPAPGPTFAPWGLAVSPNPDTVTGSVPGDLQRR